ncbi:MAG: hypothetical protein HYY26_01255 [Acidobacteria bacterium]|nr:hypothetical protein [Acidobacteriota bacterium]
MKCSRLKAQWEEWLEGRGPAELEEHLRECPRCRELSAELRPTSSWVAALREEPAEPGPAFWARLRERLEESERGLEFWPALGWAARRMAVGLAVVVLLLTVGLLKEAAESSEAEFDAPQAYLEVPPGGVPVGNGALSRDEVMLTLVAQVEPSR